MKSIAAFIAFQLVWFACAYSDVTGWIWLGPPQLYSTFSGSALAFPASSPSLVLWLSPVPYLTRSWRRLGFIQYVETAWPAGVALWLSRSGLPLPGR